MKPQQIAQTADLAIALKEAAIKGDPNRAMAIVNRLFTSNPEWIHRDAGSEAAEVYLLAHEIYDEFLRGIVFADAFTGPHWQVLLMPVRGVFPASILISNARWLRLFGSSRPDQELEELSVEALEKMSFEQQAKTLGRYISVNDGARPIDFAGINRVLDSRLQACFVHWAVCVYAASPDNLGGDEANAHQVKAVAQFIEAYTGDISSLGSSTMFMSTPFSFCYRDGFDINGLAALANGQLTTRMMHEFGLSKGDPTDGLFERELIDGGDIIFCPNWTDEHVAYRCMADAAEGMRSESTRVVMTHEPIVTREPATNWADQTISMRLPGKQHFIAEVAGVAEQLKRAKPDFLFFPELTPNNASILLATQRVARVQAAGYGYPVTTGSPNVDYFIGGSEVEGDGSEYTEQLILLPGLGVSTTTPPIPLKPRARGFTEPEVKVCSIASAQKLTQPLVSAWEAILGDRPNASLDLFAGVSANRAAGILPSLQSYLSKAKVNLHLVEPRDQVQDCLENADLYLDSFPYSGFNSLIEVLCSGCPVVTLEGTHARHRFGAAMLRRLGLPEFLMTKSRAEFISVARRLIDDPVLRLEIRAQIGTRDHVLTTMSDPYIAEHFASAVELMRQLGPLSATNPRRAPIQIQRAKVA